MFNVQFPIFKPGTQAIDPMSFVLSLVSLWLEIINHQEHKGFTQSNGKGLTQASQQPKNQKPRAINQSVLIPEATHRKAIFLPEVALV